MQSNISMSETVYRSCNITIPYIHDNDSNSHGSDVNKHINIDDDDFIINFRLINGLTNICNTYIEYICISCQFVPSFK